MGQYGNVPVSLYTGKVNLEVPIYQLKGKEISIPISLSYSSGGFKVGEIPGWTGLGFALNAGGVITRSALGRPDECFNYYDKQQEIYQNVALLNDIEKQDFYLEISKGIIETEPDVYFYNFSGQSGKFFVKADQSVVLSDYKPLEFSISNICDDLSTFIVKGPDGTTYTFADREITDLTYDDEGLQSTLDHYVYTSSWYLTTMISANGLDTIYFEYHDDAALPMLNNEMSSESMSISSHGPTSSTGSGATPPCGQISGPSVGASASTTVNRKYLKMIRLGNVEVILTSSPNSSFFGGRKLDTIQILAEGAQVKEFEFKFSFFDNPSQTFDERLRLDSLIEHGTGDEMLPPYKFEYFPNSLPSFYSKSIDHWGYSNESGNTSLIPNFQNGDCIVGGGANRETYEEGLQACVLKKITYPTGGFTQFEFGAHRTGVAPVLRQEDIEVEHTTSTQLNGGTIASGQTCAGNTRYQITNLTIPSGTSRVEITAPSIVWNEQTHGEGAKAFYGIIKSENFTYSGCDLFTYAASNYSTLFEYYWFLEGDAYAVDELPTTLPPGNYKLITINEFSFEWISAQFNYYTIEQQQVLHAPPDRVIGGLRIEKITDYESTGLVATVKKYEYTGDPIVINGQTYASYSSGLSFGDPQYSYSSTYFFEAPCDQEESSTLIDYLTSTLHLVASSRTSLGTVMGSHVGYSRIVEKMLDGNEQSNGYKLFYYRNNYISPIGFPFSHDFDEYGQGDLLKEEIYNEAGERLVKTEYEYAFDIDEDRHDEAVHGIKVYAASAQSNKLILGEAANNPGFFEWVYFANINCSTPLSSNKKTFTVKNNITSYRANAHWQYLSKTTKTEYSDETEFQTYVRNYYENAYHAQVTKVESTNSRGEMLESRIKYPGGSITGPLSTDAAQALESLNSRHVLNKVIEKIELDGSQRVLSAQRVNYTLENNKPFPKDIYFSKATAPFGLAELGSKYENRASYQYNDAGDLISYSKVNDAVESFIWSTDHRYVIADANSSSDGVLAYTSFEGGLNEGHWIFGNGVNTDSKTGKRSHDLSTSNISIEGLQPSTEYVVAFWAKGGVPNVTGVVLSTDDPSPGNDGWRFFRKIISGTSQVIISSGGVLLIDELRLHPSEARMSTYTFDPLIGMTSATDPNNITTYYEYDTLGRLTLIKDNKGNILRHFKYHYKHQQ